MKILQPAGWPRPSGFSNGIEARGKQIFVAGQVGWDPQGVFHSDDLVDQTRQALLNIISVLDEADATSHHITRMTWYVVDKQDYLKRSKDIGAVYKELIGRHYPAMTLVQVADLLEDRAKVEIEATAVVPD